MYEVAERICNNITFVYQDLSEWKPSFRKNIKINVENDWIQIPLLNKRKNKETETLKRWDSVSYYNI